MSLAPELRILFELRPALEGHAGIPQETRLLFRSLQTLDSCSVAGLIQSSIQLLPAALTEGAPDARLERQGRIVMTLDRPRSRRGDFDAALATIGMALHRNLGGEMPLTPFDPRPFREYLWQRLFAKSLPAADFDSVTAGEFRVLQLPWSALQICARFTSNFGSPIYGRIDTRGFDLMITETPYPASVAAGTQLVVRYHDAFPLLMPHTINDRDYQHATHYLTLRQNVRDRAWFVCVSEATRRDLVSVFPAVEERSLTIPNMVSHHYFAEESAPERIAEIIATYRIRAGAEAEPASEPPDYLLMVSSLEPRKNHLALIGAWEELRAQRHPALKLMLVGGAGWHNEPILQRLQPWVERGAALILRNVPADALRRLYRHARATVCPSLAEGFDFSGIEAMRSGGAVVASDIPVHREIYAAAAEYFDPHDAAGLMQSLERVIGAQGAARRAELVELGAGVATRYLPDAVIPQWAEFIRMQSTRR